MPESSRIVPSRAAYFLTAEMVIFFAAAVAYFVWSIAQGSAGFSYTLDDPYIHLALAQHIRHGMYGINSGEYSSPSSSILWPFLLAPFAESSFREWMPLFLNVLPGIALCCLLGKIVHRLYFSETTPKFFALLGIGPLLVMAADLPSLAVTGMEHTLQLLTVAACAAAMVRAYEGRRIENWMLLGAIISPIIRYEDIVFTLAVATACVIQKRRNVGIAVCLLGFLFPIAFGLYLHSHGLPFLPNSVVAKSGFFSERHRFFPRLPFLDRAIAIVGANAIAYVTSPDRWPITIFTLLFGWRALREPSRTTPRHILLISLAALLVLMAIGPYGWFYRYDVSYRLFSLVILLAVFSKVKSQSRVWLYSLVLLGASLYFWAWRETVPYAKGIALQQKQLHRFTSDFYQRNIAVNDLGWVSYDARGRFYICDLLGLASTEAAEKRVKDAPWLDQFTKKHGVELVAIYSVWFPHRPATWREIATLRRSNDEFNVTFYVIPGGDREFALSALHRFEKTLPKGAWLTFTNSENVH